MNDIVYLSDIKKSYVDVFNPSGAASKPLPPAAEVLGAPLLSGEPPPYFIPQAQVTYYSLLVTYYAAFSNLPTLSGGRLLFGDD